MQLPLYYCTATCTEQCLLKAQSGTEIHAQLDGDEWQLHGVSRMLHVRVIPAIMRLEREQNKNSHGCMDAFVGDEV